MTIKNLIEKYEKNIENLTDGMCLFENESSAIRAAYIDQIEIYETVIADLQDLAQKQGDLISREALKKTIKDSDIIHCFANLWYADILKEIDNAPTVAKDYDTGYQDGLEDGLNDIRPQGEWLENGCVGGFVCSNCNGGYNTLPKTKYCPLCGAQMVGGGENE